MSIATKQRIFVVGCPRSGTTLLQSLLAAHSDVASFPESHLFSSLVADRGKLRSTFNIASRKARPQFDTFLRELQREDLNQYLPKFSFLVRQYSHAFIRILDILSEEQGKDIWIEKTPRHLHCIDQIEKLLPEPQFIHIIRSGKDVVASLMGRSGR